LSYTPIGDLHNNLIEVGEGPNIRGETLSLNLVGTCKTYRTLLKRANAAKARNVSAQVRPTTMVDRDFRKAFGMCQKMLPR